MTTPIILTTLPVRVIQTLFLLESKDQGIQIILNYSGDSVYEERNYELVLSRPLTKAELDDGQDSILRLCEDILRESLSS